MKNFTKFTVYSITILTAYLISEHLVNFLNSKYKEPTFGSVAIGMLVIIAVYYPVMNILDKYIEKMSRDYIRKSKSLHKSNFIGALIGFSIAFFVLFVLFALVWHDMNFFTYLKNLI